MLAMIARLTIAFAAHLARMQTRAQGLSGSGRIRKVRSILSCYWAARHGWTCCTHQRRQCGCVRPCWVEPSREGCPSRESWHQAK
jgi:hypothetical protein